MGGHILGFKSNKDGCLKCLYYDDDGNPSNYIKTSLFSNPSGIVLSRNITGCAGAFTAYGSVHAMKTAVIMAEYVIENKVGLQSWCATNKLPPASLDLACDCLKSNHVDMTDSAIAPS